MILIVIAITERDAGSVEVKSRVEVNSRVEEKGASPLEKKLAQMAVIAAGKALIAPAGRVNIVAEGSGSSDAIAKAAEFSEAMRKR